MIKQRKIHIGILSGAAALTLLLAGCATGNQADSADDGAGNGSGGEDCFVQLFDGDNLDESDDNFTLDQPGEYENLAGLPGSDQDWTNEADSFRTGELTTLTVWPEENFQGESVTFEPGSEVTHPDFEPSSLEMICQ